MTADLDPQIPLAGSTTVQSDSFDASLSWFTVGDLAVVRHTVQFGQAQFAPRDMGMLGRALAMVAGGLAVQGVTFRFGVDRPMDADDPQGFAIAEAAGLSSGGTALVLRCRLPIAAGDPVPPAGGPVGRAVVPAGDAAAWSELVSAASGLFTGARPAAIPVEEEDRVAVVDDGDGRLIAFGWARCLPPSVAGSPVTAEIVDLAVAGGLDPEVAAGAERAAVRAVADLVSADGIRTLSVAVDDQDTAMVARLESVGFAPRRRRHLYVPPVA
jgi:hypothetical protein